MWKFQKGSLIIACAGFAFALVAFAVPALTGVRLGYNDPLMAFLTFFLGVGVIALKLHVFSWVVRFFLWLGNEALTKGVKQ